MEQTRHDTEPCHVVARTPRARLAPVSVALICRPCRACCLPCFEGLRAGSASSLLGNKRAIKYDYKTYHTQVNSDYNNSDTRKSTEL